jgi:hypothetical protein
MECYAHLCVEVLCAPASDSCLKVEYQVLLRSTAKTQQLNHFKRCLCYFSLTAPSLSSSMGDSQGCLSGVFHHMRSHWLKIAV